MEMIESVEGLSALRSKIARIEGRRSTESAPPAALGIASMDRALGGGLARGRLHELFAAEPPDMASAAGFAAMLAQLVLPPAAPLIWLREESLEHRSGRLHPPGLAEIGFDPSRLVLVAVPDPLMLLRAAADVTRCQTVGVAVIEPWRSPRVLDLTASRRLAIAAEESGVTVLMLRGEAEPVPSAAQTRWAISSAPCTPLEANAPGRPTFDLTLLRQRARPAGGHWRLEWHREQGCFREALPGAMAPAAGGGSLAEAMRA
jgi:protein ImuA